MFSIYSPIRLPYEYILNYDMELLLTKIHAKAMLVHDFGGNAVAIEIPYKTSNVSSSAVIEVLMKNGYDVEVEINSRIANLTVFTLMWRRKDGRTADNQGNLYGEKIRKTS